MMLTPAATSTETNAVTQIVIHRLRSSLTKPWRFTATLSRINQATYVDKGQSRIDGLDIRNTAAGLGSAFGYRYRGDDAFH